MATKIQEPVFLEIGLSSRDDNTAKQTDKSDDVSVEGQKKRAPSSSAESQQKCRRLNVMNVILIF